MSTQRNQGRSPERSEMRLDGHEDWTEPGAVQAVYRDCLKLVGRVRDLAVDLRDVRLMDSKLIACLVALRREAERRGSRVTVLASDVAGTWMDACRVRRFLET